MVDGRPQILTVADAPSLQHTVQECIIIYHVLLLGAEAFM